MKHIIPLLLLMLCFSCKESVRKPKHLIAEDKMVSILYDLYVLNGAKGINSRVLGENNLNPKQLLLAKHNVDSLQFAESNAYYTYNNKTYTKILDKVKTKIETKKKRLDAQLKKEIAAEKRRKDSLKKVKPKLGKEQIKPITFNTK